jgi:hypothetical protein
MADAGIAARRACETLIETGRVKVNGRVCDKLPAFVDPKNDRIEVDGRPLASEIRFSYIMMNKPTKVLTAPIGPGDDRPAALAMIEHPSKPRLVAVGGLDFDSSGLLLFTNDGAVVNRLTHPRYGHVRLYQAKVKGRPTPQTVANLAKGVYVFDTEDGFKPEDDGLGTRESRDMPGKSGKSAKPGERPTRKDGPQFTRGRPSNARKVQIDVKVGVMVAEDQIIADNRTVKATVVLTSPVAGRVTAAHGEPGQQLAVGSPLVEFEVEGAGNVATRNLLPSL